MLMVRRSVPSSEQTGGIESVIATHRAVSSSPPASGSPPELSPLQPAATVAAPITNARKPCLSINMQYGRQTVQDHDEKDPPSPGVQTGMVEAARAQGVNRV